MSHPPPPGPAWVVAASIREPRAADGQVVVPGLLALHPSAPAGLRPRVLLDGRELPVAWGLPSPAAADELSGALDPARSRFRAVAPPSGGWLQLVVDDPGTGPVTLACRQLLPPDHPAARQLDPLLSRVHELREKGSRDPAAYTALRRRLRRVAAPDRDLHWTEAMVVLNSYFHEQPGVVHRRLRELRALHHAAGRQDHFAALWAVVTWCMAPLTLTPHGFRLPLAARDERAVWQRIAGLADRIGELGHQVFVNSGTLLGLVREGGLLGQDDDVDLAVVLAGESADDVAASWRSFKTDLAGIGLLRLDFETEPRAHCKLVADGLSVDVFPAWVSDGRLHLWPYVQGELPAEAALPVAHRPVHGAGIPLPASPEDLLALNYGPAWGTRDPVFKFDWARARDRFADFLAAVRAAG